MSLAPCPSCSRHVRVAERACPFCRASITLAAAPARTVTQRLGRAAMFTFGAAVVAAGASACAMYGGPPGDHDANVTIDAGTDATILAMYGGPPIDAALPNDTGTDATILAMYGGPPIDSGHGDT